MEDNTLSQLSPRSIVEVVASVLKLEVEDFLYDFLWKCCGGITDTCRVAIFASEENKTGCIAGFAFKIKVFFPAPVLIFW